MFYLSEKEFRRKMKEQKIKNESAIRKQELRKEKDKYKTHKKIQTTKIITAALMIFLLVNCLAVEIYSAIAMFILHDLSALYVLIGAAVSTVLGEVLAYAVYSFKSFNETKAEKELEFEYHKFNAANDTFLQPTEDGFVNTEEELE